MAVELCSENCGVIISPMSPRISFSHDFSQSDAIPVEQQHPFSSNPSGLNSSNIDFDFHVSQSHDLESSSAEELFSGGRILPTEVKRKISPLKQTNQSAPPLQQHPPLHPSCAGGGVGSDSRGVNSKNFKKESLKESKYLNDGVCEKAQSSKSFWSFKRSSSCGSGYGRSLCPLPLLSRSNSTGSTTSSGSGSKRNNSCSKEGISIKQNPQKHSTTRFSHSYQKPPLNKSHHGSQSHGNCVRVNPVLNVPTANLFGFGSIFSNNRDKSKKK